MLDPFSSCTDESFSNLCVKMQACIFDSPNSGDVPQYYTDNMIQYNTDNTMHGVQYKSNGIRTTPIAYITGTF